MKVWLVTENTALDMILLSRIHTIHSTKDGAEREAAHMQDGFNVDDIYYDVEEHEVYA